MPVVNAIAGYAEEMKGWRRYLHQHPELKFDCHQTAAFIAERLREFGVDELHEGIATSGIVAIINGTGDVIEPEDGLVAIGSGGPYALSAARALLAHTTMDASAIATEALNIAGDICIYTNRNVVVEEL